MLVALICLADLLTRIEGPQMIQVFKTCDLKCAQIDKKRQMVICQKHHKPLEKSERKRESKCERKQIEGKQCLHLYKCCTTKLIGKAAESENN